ncbi:hypothetical protein TNCV_3291421 [Trichonephila clavipes]|nr:hypothetical protein TNCV_3291421 [Trichonephila clavipes]
MLWRVRCGYIPRLSQTLADVFQFIASICQSLKAVTPSSRSSLDANRGITRHFGLKRSSNLTIVSRMSEKRLILQLWNGCS